MVQNQTKSGFTEVIELNESGIKNISSRQEKAKDRT